MKQVRTVALWLAVAIATTSCTREYIEDVNGVCFERDVLPLFIANCTQSGCHNATDREDGYDLSSYESIVQQGISPGDYRASKIYQAMVAFGEEVMPPSPYNRLTDAQISTIALWIDEGAEKTTCDESAICDLTAVTYSGTIQPLLQNYCNGCHGGSSPLGGIDYNTYNGVKATVTDGSLLGSVRHDNGYSSMPQNGNKLSACNIARIEAWINAGAPNN